MVIKVLIEGFIIGLVASMPVGAVAVMSIQKTMNHGLWHGFLIGSAAAVVDFFYATIAVLGLSMIKDFLFAHQKILALLGSLFLIISGIKIFFSDTIKQYRSRGKKLSHLKLANDFFSSMMIAASNPVTILGYGGFFASMGVHSLLTTNFITFLFLIFLFAGALSWWFLLSFGINMFKDKIRLRTLIVINRITGVTITLMGVFIIIYIFVK